MKKQSTNSLMKSLNEIRVKIQEFTDTKLELLAKQSKYGNQCLHEFLSLNNKIKSLQSEEYRILSKLES